MIWYSSPNLILFILLIINSGCDSNDNLKPDHCEEAKRDVLSEYAKGNIIFADESGVDIRIMDFIQRDLNFCYELKPHPSKYDSCYIAYADSILYAASEKHKSEILMLAESLIERASDSINQHQFIDGYYWFTDSVTSKFQSIQLPSVLYSKLSIDSVRMELSIGVDTNGIIQDCNVICNYDSVSTALIKNKIIGFNYGQVSYYKGKKVKFRLSPTFVYLVSPPSQKR